MENVGKNVGKSVGKNVGKELNQTVKNVLALIKNNPYITIPELSVKSGLTQRTIERNINKLKEYNYIKRVGGRKKGHWKVISISGQ